MKEQFHFIDHEGNEWYRDWRNRIYRLPDFVLEEEPPKEVVDHFAKQAPPYAIVRLRDPEHWNKSTQSLFAVEPEVRSLRSLVDEPYEGIGFGITSQGAWRAFLKAWFEEYDSPPRLKKDQCERYGDSYNHKREWHVFKESVLANPNIGKDDYWNDDAEIVRDDYWVKDTEVLCVTWAVGAGMRFLTIEVEEDRWDPELEEASPQEAFTALRAIDECQGPVESGGIITYEPVRGLQVSSSLFIEDGWFDFEVTPVE